MLETDPAAVCFPVAPAEEGGLLPEAGVGEGEREEVGGVAAGLCAAAAAAFLAAVAEEAATGA